VAPTLNEAKAGASHEVMHGAGDEDLARGGQTLHTSSEVDRDPRHVGAGDFALTGVKPRPDLEAKAPNPMEKRCAASCLVGMRPRQAGQDVARGGCGSSSS
jgi:hypothetical protein